MPYFPTYNLKENYVMIFPTFPGDKNTNDIMKDESKDCQT